MTHSACEGRARARRRGPFRTGAAYLCAASAALVLWGLGSVVAPAASATPTSPTVLDCGASPQVEPSSLTVACGDGSQLLKDISWSSWTAQSASGTGTYSYNDCNPDCASGHFQDAPGTTIQLGSPVNTVQGAEFSQLTYTYPNPTQTGGPSPSTVTLQTDPPVSTVPPSCSGKAGSGVVGMATTADGNGYWIANGSGAVYACGDAANLGGISASPSDPVVAIAAAPDGHGYWLVTSLGRVAAFGDAVNHGDVSNVNLNASIVAMAADPATGGYWLLGGDGGVFSFDAPFYGSTGNIRLFYPAVGMAPSLDGGGYYFVALDGGVFAYGDAHFAGSAANLALNEPVIGMAVDPATGGYWLDATDGGIFSYNAPFYGSTGNIQLAQPCVGMSAMPDGGGYRFVASDGGIFDFGSAGFYGSAA